MVESTAGSTLSGQVLWPGTVRVLTAELSQQSILLSLVFLSNRVKEIYVRGVHLPSPNTDSSFLDSAGNDFIFSHLRIL